MIFANSNRNGIGMKRGSTIPRARTVHIQCQMSKIAMPSLAGSKIYKIGLRGECSGTESQDFCGTIMTPLVVARESQIHPLPSSM